MVTYHVHGWFELRDDTYESEMEVVSARAAELRAEIDRLKIAYSNRRMEVWSANGTYLLTIHGNSNHRTNVDRDIRGLLEWVAGRLPGSFGLLYESDDEPGLPAGTDSLTVHVLARGRLSLRDDPFFSPINPAIED